MRRVWEAYRQASPPFPATYETFRTYCVKHGLSKLRYPTISEPAESTPTPALRAKPLTPVPKTKPSPKVWPRLPGKPREFIPRTEDD